MNAIKENDSNIIESLLNVLPDLIKNHDYQREIDDNLASIYKIPRGKINEILINNEKLNQLTDVELCVLTLVIFEVTKDENLTPTKFFSTREINKALKYRFSDSGEVELPYTIENVLSSPTGRDFLTILSYQEVAALWHSNIITYNFDTQRLSKKKLKKNGIISEKPDVNLRSVKNIVRLMNEGKYKQDTITLNILVDGEDKIEFSDGELTIHEGTKINLVDGMHRVQAILSVIEENPDFEGYINCNIKYFPLSDAQFMIGQVNLTNRFDKTLVKHYMGESIGAQITKDLMKTPELTNKVSIKTTLDKKFNYLTNFAILSEAIQAIFEPVTNKDRYDFTDVLKKFFGYLIPSYDKEFRIEYKESAKKSWFNHHNTFVVFVAVAHGLYKKYGKDFPVDEITRIIDSINFSKESGEFNDLMTSQGKVNSNQVKSKIRKFAEEKVEQLLS